MMDASAFRLELEDLRHRMVSAEAVQSETAVHAARVLGCAVVVGTLLEQVEVELQALHDKAAALLAPPQAPPANVINRPWPQHQQVPPPQQPVQHSPGDWDQYAAPEPMPAFIQGRRF